MNKAATKINTLLDASTDVQAVIADKFFWELAPKNEKLPFVTYRILENQPPSKDRTGAYDVKIYCFAKTLTASADLSELIKAAMQTQSNIYFRGAISGYNDSEAQEGFIELNFNFKI